MDKSRRRQSVDELLEALVSLVVNWNAVSTQGSIAREVGIRIAAADIRALYTIGMRGGSMRPAELARELSLSRPTTSKLLARLEVTGLAVRSPGDGGGDGRAVTIVFTRQGQEAYDRLVEAGARIVERALGDRDPADIDALTKLAGRLTVEVRE